MSTGMLVSIRSATWEREKIRDIFEVREPGSPGLTTDPIFGVIRRGLEIPAR
jgi:hypothetical protein